MAARASFDHLDRGMQLALEQAWASTTAGSLGIGAAAMEPNGEVAAVGRNRINETDPGDDVLAGSSLAHAEMNVLAKLPFRGHDALALHTTLQPCVQCLGAIRLSAVSSVSILAPDPLFRGVERMRDLTPFMARRWPEIRQRPVDEWSVMALLSPSVHMFDHPTLSADWIGALPGVAALAEANPPIELSRRHPSVVDAADELWGDLADGVDEVTRLASDDGS